MKKQDNDYIVSLTGLSSGFHDYQYDIDENFFGMFDFSEIKKGNVKVILKVEKQETMFVLSFKLQGDVCLTCDRCNSEYNQNIDSKYVMFLKYGAECMEESDNVTIITVDQREYDIASLIYEYIILSLPVHRVHPNVDQCDQEVIEYLQNQETVSRKEGDEIDPRWKCLQELNLDEK